MGRPDDWSRSVAVGTTAAFEILNIDLERQRIGVALVDGFVEPDGGAPPARPEAESAQGFGSLADKLRGALEPRLR